MSSNSQNLTAANGAGAFSTAAAGDSFVWIGPISGIWGTAGNWKDTTTGANPAGNAPGATDSVTFSSPTNAYQIVSGTGAAASLTFTGETDIVGSVSAGTVAMGVVGNLGTLLINNGGSLSAASLAFQSNSSLTLNTGTLAVSGNITGGTIIGATKGVITVGGSLGSTVAAASNSRVQAATASILTGGYFTVDATSSIEIGTAGGAALGALTVDAGVNFNYTPNAAFAAYGIGIMAGNGGTLIDNGVITIGNGAGAYLGGTAVIGSGKIVVQNGASLYGSASGNLRFELGQAASFSVAALASTNTVVFTAASGVLNLTGTLVSNNSPKANTYSYAVKAAIVGWDVTDIVNIDTAVTKAVYSNGSLVLSNGTTTVTTLTLTGDYAGRQFLVIPTGTTQTPTSEIVLAAAAAPGPSAGSGHGDSYVWVGAASGDWNTAANWKDVNTGAQPASVAPGSSDNVVFNSAAGATFLGTQNSYQIISGIGNSNSLLMQGNNYVFGTLSTGAVTVGPATNVGLAAGYTSDLRIGLGGRINASSLAFGTGAVTSLTVAGGTLSVSGDVGIGGRIKALGGSILVGGALSGLLDEVDNGTVAIGGTLNTDLATNVHNGARVTALGGLINLTVDATSSVEFGNAGNAALGAITVDSGVSATARGYLVSSGNLVDNGNVTVAEIKGAGAFTAGSYASINKLGTISGTGRVNVQDNAGISTTNEVVAPGSIAFQLGKNAVLSIGRVGAGNTIALAGGGDVLNLYEADPYNAGVYTYGVYDVKAAISGFDSSDVISISALVTTATYSAGVLTLKNGTTQVASLTLSDNFAGKSFIAVATGAKSSQIMLTASPAAGPSAGTTTGHAYTYTGTPYADWNVASNWTDITTGSQASVAPGAKDAVTFNSPVSYQQVIGGVGSSASLALNGGLTEVVGTLTTGALVESFPMVGGVAAGYAGTLRISSGGMITAASVSASYVVQVVGGTLVTTGNASAVAGFTADSGSITIGGVLGSGVIANNAARVKVASANVVDSNILVDATSSVEVGGVGGAAAGALTVDAGATLAYTRGVVNNANSQLVFAGNALIDNGLITVGGIRASSLIAANSGTASVSGSGRIVVQDGASLSTVGGTIAAGSLGLEIGRAATLTVDKAVAGNTITFKAAGGVLNIAPAFSFSPPYGYTYNMKATIAGFDATDAITTSTAITNADYNAGVLTLSNGTTAVTTLTVSGNYAGQSFLVVPVSGGIYQVSLFAGTVFVAGNAITVGALAGATASLDTLFADTALVTNKTVNTLTINGPGTVALSGSVTINNLFVSGGGVFVLNGAVVKTDPVTVDAGTNITGAGTLTGVITDNGTITASGGTLILTDAINGTGALGIAAGSTLELDGAVASSLGLGFSAGNETLLLGASAAVSATITGFGVGDTIALKGQQITAAAFDAVRHVLSITGADSVVRQLAVANTNSASDFTLQNGVVTDLACFAAGTMITTPQGEVAVEDLVVGCEVVTMRHPGTATRRVAWLGHRDVDCARHPQPQHAWPVRVEAGAFGGGLPRRALFLSPEHAVYCHDVLIPVRELINGHSIAQVRCDRVTYWHVELDAHDVVLAEGLPAESYLENGNRSDFVEARVVSLHPTFGGSDVALHPCAPVRRQGPEVQAVRGLVDGRQDVDSAPHTGLSGHPQRRHGAKSIR